MALVACQECSQQVSTRARACPHCGCPRMRLPAWPYFVLIAIIIGFYAFYAAWLRSYL